MKRIQSSWLAIGSFVSLAGCGAMVAPNEHDASIVDATPVDAAITNDAAITSDAPPTHDAFPIPAHCWQYDPTQLITPTVLMQGQTFGMTAATRGRTYSCGATPLLDGRADQLNWSLSACGGCEACDCIDPGYEGSGEVTGLAAGTYSVRVGNVSQPMQVVPAEQCIEMPSWPGDALRVEVVGPDTSLRHTGPMLWWAHITGTESRCCGEPLLGGRVAPVRPADADLGLSLYECNPDLCACVGGPRPVEAWIELGELTPGTHGLHVNGTAIVVMFNVPGIR